MLWKSHHVHLTPPGSPSSGDCNFLVPGSRKKISVNSLNRPHSASYKFIFELSSYFSHSRLSSPSVHWTRSVSPLICHSGHFKLSLSADSFSLLCLFPHSPRFQKSRAGCTLSSFIPLPPSQSLPHAILLTTPKTSFSFFSASHCGRSHIIKHTTLAISGCTFQWD